jgi:hypothetical protein
MEDFLFADDWTHRNYNEQREKRRKIEEIADDAGLDTF